MSCRLLPGLLGSSGQHLQPCHEVTEMQGCWCQRGLQHPYNGLPNKKSAEESRCGMVGRNWRDSGCDWPLSFCSAARLPSQAKKDNKYQAQWAESKKVTPLASFGIRYTAAIKGPWGWATGPGRSSLAPLGIPILILASGFPILKLFSSLHFSSNARFVFRIRMVDAV